MSNLDPTPGQIAPDRIDPGQIASGQIAPGRYATPTWSTSSALPTEPRAYHQFLRTPRAAWWRGVLAIVSLVAAYLVVSLVLGALAVAVDIGTGRTSLSDYGNGSITVTPMLFLANNLSLAALLPLSMLLHWGFFGQRPRWLSSVQGGFRWRWFARAALIIIPIWVVYAASMTLVEPLPSGRLATDAVSMLVIILLTTPLQAAGEEYGARGLIARASGSWAADPRIALVIALVVSNLLFTVAHAATDPWLLVYYFVFGTALGVVAWRTGGLEAPVLIHAVNNLIFLVPAALFGDLSHAFDRGPGAGGPWVVVPMIAMIVAVLAIEWWARRNAIVREAAPGAPAAPTEQSPQSAPAEPGSAQEALHA